MDKPRHTRIHAWAQLTRRWRQSRLSSDWRCYRSQCNVVRKLISRAKASFLLNLVLENSSNPRSLWKTLNSILHRNPPDALPNNTDTTSLANAFLDCFTTKIERIRIKFPPTTEPDPFINPISAPPTLQASIPPRSRKLENMCLPQQIGNANWTSYQHISWKNALKNSARSSPHWSIIHWQKDVFPQHVFPQHRTSRKFSLYKILLHGPSHIASLAPYHSEGWV